MIATGIDNSSLLSAYPAIANYYPLGWTTYDEPIQEALRQVVRELKKHRKKLTLYCTPLPLQAEQTVSATETSALVADTLDRMLFQVNVKTFNGNCSFTLYGTNDDGTTADEIGSLQFTDTGTKYLVFQTTYKKYKVTITTSTSTTYYANLIESSFYHAHLWLSMALAFKTIVKNEGDRFDYLSKSFEQRYLDEMNTMVATYDEDGSGDVDTDELSSVNAIEFLR